MFALGVRFFILLSSSIASDVNLLNMLAQLCPKSLDCQLNNTENSNVTEAKWHACCGKCSCDENCGQTQSCCFVEDNVRYLKTHETHEKECIDPFVGDAIDFQQYGGHGFVMVTKCLDRNEECKYKNGTLNVNPVESTTAEVFINKECARCNDVSSVIPWNARIISNGKKRYSFRNFVYEPPSSANYPECYSSFVTVNVSKCPNELYKEACISTFLPFITRVGTYQNVFCYLCLESYLPSCSAFSRTIPGTYLLLLNNRLDTATITDYFSREHMLIDRDTCQEGYMPHPSRDLCLPLFCPNNRLKIKGNCVLMIQKIITKGFALELEANIKDNGTLISRSAFKTDDRYILRSRCLDLNWTYVGLFALNSIDSNATHFLRMILIQIYSSEKEFLFSQMLSSVRECAQSTWEFRVNGHWSSVSFNFPYAQQYDREELTRDTLTESSSMPETRKDVPYAISKLDFCQQVRLVNEEYTWTSQGFILITSVNLTLDNNQYDLEPCAMCSHDNAIWVCAQDLNPEWWGQQGVSVASFVQQDKFVLSAMYGLLLVVNDIAF